MSGWAIGYIVGIAVVAVVVVLLALMIRGADRAVTKAGAILAALEATRDNTAPLWAVDDVNRSIERITDGAAAVRGHLEATHGTEVVR
jgi:Na+-transporting methylmalonyl-CoA/oxaloacetate decarboxylase gamma subunit